MLNEIIATVTIVIQIVGGSVVGTASGFFYKKNEALFLVTNQHVMRNEKEGIIPDKLRLRLHTDLKDLRKSGKLEIPLYKNGRQLWKIHPKHPNADVALIKINGDSIKKKFHIKAWSKSSFLPSDFLVNPGEDVFIIGYPLNFYDKKNNLPIFRDAMIASTYRVNFQGEPLFLTDANLHPGTSGSPVITKPKNIWESNKGVVSIGGGPSYYLLGVHSGTVNPKITGGKDIGLGATWYAELIEDIAKTF